MSNIIDKIQLSGVTYTIGGGGGGTGGTAVEEMTQAQYDAAATAGTLDDETLYIITDAEEINANDYVTKASNVASGLTVTVERTGTYNNLQNVKDVYISADTNCSMVNVYFNSNYFGISLGFDFQTTPSFGYDYMVVDFDSENRTYHVWSTDTNLFFHYVYAQYYEGSETFKLWVYTWQIPSGQTASVLNNALPEIASAIDVAKNTLIENINFTTDTGGNYYWVYNIKKGGTENGYSFQVCDGKEIVNDNGLKLGSISTQAVYSSELLNASTCTYTPLGNSWVNIFSKAIQHFNLKFNYNFYENVEPYFEIYYYFNSGGNSTSTSIYLRNNSGTFELHLGDSNWSSDYAALTSSIQNDTNLDITITSDGIEYVKGSGGTEWLSHIYVGNCLYYGSDHQDSPFSSMTDYHNSIGIYDAVETLFGNYEDGKYVETSAITSAVTSASTDAEIPTAKAVYDALGDGTVDGISLFGGTHRTSEGTSIKYFSQMIEGGKPSALKFVGNGNSTYSSAITIALYDTEDYNLHPNTLTISTSGGVATAITEVNGGSLTGITVDSDCVLKPAEGYFFNSYQWLTNNSSLGLRILSKDGVIESGSTTDVIENGIYKQLQRHEENIGNLSISAVTSTELSFKNESGITLATNAGSTALAVDDSLKYTSKLGVYVTGDTYTNVLNSESATTYINLDGKKNVDMWLNQSYTGTPSGWYTISVRTFDYSYDYYLYENDTFTLVSGYAGSTLNYDSSTGKVSITCPSGISYLQNGSKFAPADDLTNADCFIGLVSYTSNEYTIQEAIDNKVDTSDVTTAVTSGSTDAEIPTAKAVYDAIQEGGGGGKAIEAGRGISVTTGETADTVSFNLPISAGTSNNSIRIGSGGSSDGVGSVSVGYRNTANGQGAFAQGGNTWAHSAYGHTEGQNTEAAGDRSHAEGYYTTANTEASHAEGRFTKTSNRSEHAEGEYNVSVSASTTFGDSGNTLFSVGNGTADNARHNAFEIRQNGDIYLTKDGQDVKLQDQLGGSSYTAGDGIDITNDVISVTGKVDTSTYNTYTAATDAALATKQTTLTAGTNITIVDNVISATGGGGGSTYTAGRGINITNDTISFSLPISAGTGTNSIIENYTSNVASGSYSHAEGRGTTAGTGSYTHAEGYNTKASGSYSHAEGASSLASGSYTHAEGSNTKASGQYSHAEGYYTTASTDYTHAEGYNTKASGKYSHAEGSFTTAKNEAEHASGQYNVSSSASTTFGDSGNTLFSVGNGTNSARHNAFEIRQNGDIYFNDGTNDVKLQDKFTSIETTIGDINTILQSI